jgi:hypothetical protein
MPTEIHVYFEGDESLWAPDVYGNLSHAKGIDMNRNSGAANPGCAQRAPRLSGGPAGWKAVGALRAQARLRHLQNSANRLLARAAYYSPVETAALTEPGPEGTPRGRGAFRPIHRNFASASRLPAPRGSHIAVCRAHTNSMRSGGQSLKPWCGAPPRAMKRLAGRAKALRTLKRTPLRGERRSPDKLKHVLQDAHLH